jgi:hypothetical protein
LIAPSLADELVGGEGVKGFQSPREVIGCDEVVEMPDLVI